MERTGICLEVIRSGTSNTTSTSPKDPKQYTNLAAKPEFAPVVEDFKAKFPAKLRASRDNDRAQQ